MEELLFPLISLFITLLKGGYLRLYFAAVTAVCSHRHPAETNSNRKIKVTVGSRRSHRVWANFLSAGHQNNPVSKWTSIRPIILFAKVWSLMFNSTGTEPVEWMVPRPLSTLFTKQAEVLFHCSTTMSQQLRLNVSLKLMMWGGGKNGGWGGGLLCLYSMQYHRDSN